MTEPREGVCRSCGRTLVQAEGRTYHPASEYHEAGGVRCPSLQVIYGTENWPNGPSYSLDVPASVFEPWEDPKPWITEDGERQVDSVVPFIFGKKTYADYKPRTRKQYLEETNAS